MPFEIRPSWKFMDVMWQLQRWTESCPRLVERTIVICWGIWKNRNEVRHGDIRRNGKAIVRSLLRVLDEFQIANERPQSTREPFPNEIKWCPPQLGCYKVNVDGAMFYTKIERVGEASSFVQNIVSETLNLAPAFRTFAISHT